MSSTLLTLMVGYVLGGEVDEKKNTINVMIFPCIKIILTWRKKTNKCTYIGKMKNGLFFYVFFQ